MSNMGCHSWSICVVLIINNLFFLITFNTPNPCSNPCSAFLELTQVVSTQICDHCFWIFKHLKFFSLFGLAIGHLTFWSSWSSIAGSHYQPFKMGLYYVRSCDQFHRAEVLFTNQLWNLMELLKDNWKI
jgi:hypothetical protein